VDDARSIPWEPGLAEPTFADYIHGMNIFHLHADPEIAAQMMSDRHVVKMTLESAQLLCTAHRVLEQVPSESPLYKATHRNHPSALWARASVENYQWLYRHFLALCSQYTRRYGKVHRCETLLAVPLSMSPQELPHIGQTPFHQTMPPQYRQDDPVEAYRLYYQTEKLKKPADIERYYSVLGKSV
jgi:hypothetical protein